MWPPPEGTPKRCPYRGRPSFPADRVSAQSVRLRRPVKSFSLSPSDGWVQRVTWFPPRKKDVGCAPPARPPRRAVHEAQRLAEVLEDVSFSRWCSLISSSRPAGHTPAQLEPLESGIPPSQGPTFLSPILHHSPPSNHLSAGSGLHPCARKGFRHMAHALPFLSTARPGPPTTEDRTPEQEHRMQAPIYQSLAIRTDAALGHAAKQRRAVIAGLTASALLFLAGFGFAGYFWSLQRQFPKAPFKQPPALRHADPLEPASAHGGRADREWKAAGYGRGTARRPASTARRVLG